MDSSGEKHTSVGVSTDTGLVNSRGYWTEERAAAERMLREEEEDEDLCFNIVSSFINSLEARQWENLRGRMRLPLSQDHLAQVSKRIIRVVSELVFQLLLPILTVPPQAKDFSEASAKKSSQSRSEDETQSKDSRYPLGMGLPFVEDPVQSGESLAKSSGMSDSQSSASSILGEAVQQVNRGLSVLTTFIPPLESSEKVSAEQASWQDPQQFLELATQEVISAIVRSLDICQEKTETGMKTKSTAWEILKDLAIRMRCSTCTKAETKDQHLDTSNQDSWCDSGTVDVGCCWCLRGKVKISTSKEAFGQKDETPQGAKPEVRHESPPQDMTITYPMTVSTQEVIKDLSCRRFRNTSLKELKGLLLRSVLMFSSRSVGAKATLCEPCMASLDTLSVEMLDTVVNSVKQLCQPQPRKFTFPWQQSKNTTVSEDRVVSVALELKLNLQEKLQNFHKKDLDKLMQDKMEEERKSLTPPLSNWSDERAEDTQEDNGRHSHHSTMAGLCDSPVKNMAGVVKSFLDEMEQSLKQDGSSVESDDAVLTGLEDLISKDKLFTFSKLLADKVMTMFHQQEVSLTKSMDHNRKALSDSDLSQPTRCLTGFITPSEQVYVFVEEAVKHLLASLVFPPPSWGMGHMIQVQNCASSAANWAESVRKYEAVMDDYTQLMADQVIGSLGRISASSRLQQEVGGLLPADAQDTGSDEVLDGVAEPKKKNITDFFQELSDNIRRKWRTLTNKEL